METLTDRQTLIAEALRKFPKAKKIAVENFTMGKEGKGMDMGTAINLSLDAELYKWNSDTVKAIRFVIRN